MQTKAGIKESKFMFTHNLILYTNLLHKRHNVGRQHVDAASSLMRNGGLTRKWSVWCSFVVGCKRSSLCLWYGGGVLPKPTRFDGVDYWQTLFTMDYPTTCRVWNGFRYWNVASRNIGLTSATTATTTKRRLSFLMCKQCRDSFGFDLRWCRKCPSS